MQTFLPATDFAKTASMLDRARLGKQRIEAKQIINTLFGNSQGWKNHPAVNMWRGYEAALALYGLAICDEWIYRGYSDSLRPFFIDVIACLAGATPSFHFAVQPHWLHNPRFTASHRAALLAKYPEHYSQFGWIEEPKIDYFWPTKD